MQKELYRARTQGRSPLWPGWDGSVSQNNAHAAFTMMTPPTAPSSTAAGAAAAETGSSDNNNNNNNSAANPTSRKSSKSSGSCCCGDDDGDGADGNGSENSGNSSSSSSSRKGGRTSFDGRSDISGRDPCDLDAEELSYWAAQNVEAGPLVKHEWLASTSTTARLKGVRDLCRFALTRHRDRSGVDGSVLSRPLSALRDLTSR